MGLGGVLLCLAAFGAGACSPAPTGSEVSPVTSSLELISLETAPPETAPPETAPPETAPPETAPPETAPPETAPPETEHDEPAPRTLPPVSEAQPSEHERSISQLSALRSSPALTVSQSTNLNRVDAQISVIGSGFDPAASGGNGVYVVFGPKPAQFWLNANLFGAAVWVHPGATASAAQAPLNADGTFGTTLTVDAKYTDGDGKSVDCTKTDCFVMAFGAHGSTDRTQDAFTKVSFAKADSTDTTQPGSSTTDPQVSTPNTTQTPNSGVSNSDAGNSSNSGANNPNSGSNNSANNGSDQTAVLNSNAIANSNSSSTAPKLAQTGVESSVLLMTSLSLVAAGAALVSLRRRRC